MSTITLVSFVAATGAVALLTYVFVRRMAVSSNATEEYFTGGRALSWPIVAGSLLLTNLSTEQLVGLNGAVFKDGNLVGFAWEALAAFAMIATALLFLPRYLASGFTTTPAFLEQRFDRATRQIVSALFLFGYVTVLLPVVLYTGSLALQTMFDVQLPLWVLVTGIGLLGSWYAIFGGLKSVAVSDTFNGVGLLVGGLAVPVLALAALGEGSVFAGLSTLIAERPEALAVLARTRADGEPVSVPWDTLLTGMMFIQIFYWSTNQVIVQRAMGARSLAEGQKGVLFAAVMKLIGPLMLCLPGIIALHMTDQLDLSDVDRVYPAIARHVLPDWSLGLFAAVLVGSILSSFNSALNSASTLFCLEFYQDSRFAMRVQDPSKRGTHVVAVGKLFGGGLALASMLIAPWLAQAESIFEYLQKVNGLYSVPIISIFLVGVLTRRSPAAGAKAAIAVGIVLYGVLTFFPIEGLHWLHAYFISFMASVLTLALSAQLAPRTMDEIHASEGTDSSPVDLTPWRYARMVAVGIVVVTFASYATLQSLSM